MKKIIILFGALLFFSTAVFAQVTSLTIGTNQANVGDTVSVPINGSSFNNVGSISLKIGYNSSTLNFLGVANTPAGVTFTAGANNGQIALGWFDATASTPYPVANGKIVDLRFIVSGASNLSFIQDQCEIINELGNQITPITFNNGAVGLFTVNLSIPSLLVTPGSTISVPIIVKKFANIGSISLKVNYSSTALSFTNITIPNGISLTANAANGVIAIGWYDATGTNPVTLPDSSVLLNMNFTYNGGSAPLTFNTSQSELLNGSGTVIAGVTYNNGAINPLGGVPTVSLANITAVASAPVIVPLNVQAFNNIGSFSFKINYNAAALTFNGLTGSYNGITITNNAVNGVISIGWFDPTGNTPISIANGVLTNLNFAFTGGNNPLSFNTSVCEILDGAGNIISGTIYQNGSVNLAVAPTVPVLTSPLNGAVNQSVKPTLTWGVVTTATSYRVQVSLDSLFTTNLIKDTTLTNTSLALKALLNGQTYVWKVSAINIAGASAFSVPFIFTTIVAAPVAPVLQTPANGAVDQPLSLSLTWGAVTGASTYRIQVATSPTFIGTSIVVNDSLVATNSKSVTLKNGTKYFWRVSASNLGGTSAYSTAFNFTTIAAAPGAPTLISPANNAVIDSLKTTLTWSAVTTATSYRVQVGSDPNFTTPIKDTVVTTESLAISFLQDNDQYFWRVYAINAGGQTVSIIFSFSVEITGIKEDLSGIPSNFNLYQNFPNPFNPSTIIRYDIAKEGMVSIKIYNIIGKEISTLVNANKQAGKYYVTFDASHLPSGLYICTIKTKDFSSVRKLMLLK